jgi:DNA-binding MarR family transcriptional regulator
MAAMERETRTLSAQNILISQAIADRLGINSTDLKCLDLARAAMHEIMTAGELAAATGLTSGAITGALDRLEGAGLVHRLRDPSDRRKVVVRPTSDAERTMPSLLEPLHRAMTALWDDYSDAELELILDFMTRTHLLMKREGAAALGRNETRLGPQAREKRRQARLSDPTPRH